MPDQSQLAREFAQLHKKGSPVILYNIWDPGSAQAVAACGAKAIATGSHGVANANGYEDGEQIPLDLALANARRVVEVCADLPVSIDVESGYGTTPDEVAGTVRRVMETGIVGINIEDTDKASGALRPVVDQAAIIKAIRSAANDAGIPLFINARTDLFKGRDASEHAGLMDEALERGRAYAEAGASGFFPVLVADLELLRRLADEVALPLNIIYLPGKGIPEPRELADAGVSRISYGPGPYLAMIEWLKENARKALSTLD